MKLRIAAIGLMILTAITGCNTAGPRGLKTGRVLYNEVLRHTNNEQLLLNLVRLRYRDTPVALGVSNISTQYELAGSASLSAGPTPSDDFEDYGASFGLSYTESPTISFTPLQGSAFVTEMLNPIKPEALFIFIPDNDLSSKSTFVMLTQLSSLAAGSVPMVTPLLTLPLR